MGGTWRNSLRELLRDLDVAQRDLSVLQNRKRAALVEGDNQLLRGLAQEETILGQQLRGLLDRRTALLEHARATGLTKTSSLTGLVAALQPDERADIQPHIEQVQQRAKQIRRESWVQWIIAHRAFSHYSSLLELIAQSGRQSPTYDAQPNKQSAGGAIFDASI